MDPLTGQAAPAPAVLRLGAMLETPALLWQLEALFDQADFVSLGTNDLFQFLFAADRTNPATSGRFDPLHPWVLGLLKSIAAAAAQAGKPVSICGEMAGNPLEAMALLGCGFRRLSMAPNRVPAIKSLVRGLDMAALAVRVDALAVGQSAGVREALAGLARDQGLDPALSAKPTSA